MTSQIPKISAAEARKLRLSQALRANMKRRKQQVRGRSETPSEQAGDDLDESNDGTP